MSDGWVAVLQTGGTIGSRRGSDGIARPSGEMPDVLGTTVAVRTSTVMCRDSSTFDFADMDAIVDAVEDALREPGCRGVVVLHGTDTLEESALAVDLFHADPRPVVFTGAQRTADHPEPDGPVNAAHAIAVAADPASRDRGVLVCFGGRTVAARGVRKTHTTDTAGFDGEHCARVVLPRCRLAGTRVDVVAIYPGADGVAIDALVRAGARGLVLEALGSGNADDAVVAAVGRATARGARVVVTTRVPFGRVVPGYAGGSALVAAGAVHEPVLRAGQARVALAADLVVRTGGGVPITVGT